MSKLIKLVQSPFQSPIDEAYGLIFQIHVPYDKEQVTLLVNPNISDYSEKEGNDNIQISQFMFSQHTKDTKTISLDFKTNNTQIIENDNKNIEIKLMNIGSENIEGQDFPFFEIQVSEQE